MVSAGQVGRKLTLAAKVAAKVKAENARTEKSPVQRTRVRVISDRGFDVDGKDLRFSAARQRNIAG